MNIQKYNKWLNESISKRNVYILIGPPAVGKSTWVEKNIPSDKVIISKDDIIEKVIFPKYQLANKDIFKAPDEKSKTGDEHPEKKKLGKIVAYKRFSRSKGKEVEERTYENAKAAGEELNKLYDAEIREAISSDKKNIVVDAIHMTKSTRKSSIELFPSGEFNIIGVIFTHKGFEKQISKSAELRAKAYLDKYGPEFDRSVSLEEYDSMYSKYEEPSASEGFDEIIKYSRFEKTDKELQKIQPLDEILVLATREYLNEGKLSKYWKKRMESRSNRAKREPKNSIDKEWAEKQQEKSRKINSRIHKSFEKEIELTDDITEEIEEYIKNIKKKKEEYKKRLAEKARLIPLNKKRPRRKLKPPPTNSEIGSKGVAGAYRIKSKKSKSPTIAPGENFGPMNEETE